MAYQSKNHRKFLATSLTAAMVASAVAPAVSAASFPDVKDDNFYASYVNQLADAGIIEGMPNGTFGLREKVTRAQAAKMVSLIRGLDTANAPAASFEDVKQDAWYADYINALYAEKLVDGVSETEFAPNGTLTRAQFAKLVVDAYGLELKPETTTPFTDVKEDVWYTDYVKTLYANKLINGKTATTFEPNSTIDRADFAKLLVDADLEFGFTLGVAKVTGVTATNPTTLTFAGTGLKNLKAENITVDGNTVSAVTASDANTATATLANKLTPGKEYKVTVKVGEETKEFTVKYTFNVNNVAISTTTIDNDRNGQKLAFTVDGAAADLDYLVNVAGWTVQYQADTAVFENAGAASKTSSTGEIREEAVNINQSFNVKVVLTKGGLTVESPSVKVNVVNDNETPAIGSVVLTNYATSSSQGGSGTAEDFEMNSTTLVTGEAAVVDGILSSTGDVINISGSATYSSSNLAVATVNSSGVITAVAPGKSTITVTAGTQTYKVDITVANTARTVSRLVPENSTVKVAPGVDPVVAVEAFDQYGDPIQVVDADVAETSTLAVGQFTTTEPGVGTVQVTTETTTAAGSYPVYLKVGGVVLGQFNVVVTTDNVANTPKLEAAKTTVSKGGALTLNANLYTTSGGFVRSLESNQAPTAADVLYLKDTATNEMYSLEVVDTDIAGLTASVNDTDIAVVGENAGSTEIVLKDANGTQVAKYTLTVTDSPVKVTAVNWKANGNTVSNTGKTLTVADALTIETVDGHDIVKGLTLNTNTTSKVRIDESDLSGNTADIYLDKNDNGALDGGEKLGQVAVTLTGATGLSLGNLGALDTTAVGDKGTFIFTFTDTVSSPAKVLSSTTLNVDVK
jgi:hypothetical protein